ncbi:MAG: uroporphyrinogen decarboxylase family protein [bacterium]
MTPKERVYKTLNFEEPDRIPVGEFATDYEMVEKVLGHETFWRGHFKTTKALWEGRRDEVVESMKKDIVEFTLKLELDMVPVVLVPSKYKEVEVPKKIGENTWEDREGNIYQYAEKSQWLICVKHADAEKKFTPEDFVYEEPEEPDDSELELIRYVVEKLGKTHFIFARSGDGSIAFPGGMERGLIMMVEEPELVRMAVKRNAKITEFYDRIYIREGVDALAPGADYSTTRGPLMSPKIVEDLFFPAMKAHCDFAHRHNVKILKHACGNNWPIMDYFVNAGYDAYQAIQSSAGMDIRKLKELYGDRIALWGGVNTENLIGGTKEDVVRDVEYAIQYAAPGGGFIFGSSHSIAIGTKYENYIAMLEEIRKRGVYK